jgi:tetratricopeptide (TPR) repeat protein
MSATRDDNELAGIEMSAWDAPEPPAGFADAVHARTSSGTASNDESVAAGAVEPVATSGRRTRMIVGIVTAAAVAAAAVLVATRVGRDDGGDGSAASAAQVATLQARVQQMQAELDRLRQQVGSAAVTPAPVASLPGGGSGTAVVPAPTRAPAPISADHAAGSTMLPPIGPAPAVLPGPCDAAALAHQGAEQLTAGRYDAAIALFDASIACHANSQAYHLALVAACDLQDPTLEKKYLAHMGVQADQAKANCARHQVVRAIGPQAASSGQKCDAAQLSQLGKDEINEGLYTESVITLEMSERCEPDPSLYRLILLGACNSANAEKAQEFYARLPANQQSAARQMCVRNRIVLPDPDAPIVTPTDTTSCDADDLTHTAKTQMNAGLFEAALQSLELSLKCKPDLEVYPLVVLAACDSNNAAKAKAYFAKLPGDRRDEMATICRRQNIELQPGVPHPAVAPTSTAAAQACDAPALAQRGKDEINVGQFAQAVKTLEAAYKCQPDESLVRLILLAACNSHNPAKAKLYFTKLPEPQMAAAGQMCIRNGIPLP